MKKKKTSAFVALMLLCHLASGQQMQRISQAELRDKISGYFIGQLVGNYLGFPFENNYVEEPLPMLVDRYYTFQDDSALNIHRQDLRGYMNIIAGAMEGAVSDDDTDIELVTLYGVEKYGLDITHPEITEMWKTHINRKIWVANRAARALMDSGLVAPATGAKTRNPYWYAIDPQLVNEIWSAFYPGMPRKAAQRAEWGARITNDDWGTHPTIAYGVMYSAAFFEKDVNKLVQMALEVIPEGSPFREGVQDVIRWHGQQPEDWRATRQKIHQKYYRYKKGDYEAPVSVVSSLNNGLCGIMAILYGQGDFTKTVGIAVSAGYDCDNQAATCGGLIGVLNGAGSIPEKFTHELPAGNRWKRAFNNAYINYTRDQLPNYLAISDIVDRIMAITEKAILQNGGNKETDEGGRLIYIVQNDW